MMNWITGIATGAPIWVWPLLLVLVWLGIRSSRQRSSHVIGFYVLPLFGIMSLNSIFDLPLSSVALPAFGLGTVVGALWGYVIQGRWIVGYTKPKITVAGEWMTLVVLMVIFWSNFVSGTLQVVSPDTIQSTGFNICFAAILGITSGTFIGRALRVLRHTWS